MKTKRPRGRPLAPLAPGPHGILGFRASRPELLSIRAAAKRAHMSVSAWCRSVLVPIALNALADVAARSTVLDKIRQEVKVAEQTFYVAD